MVVRGRATATIAVGEMAFEVWITNNGISKLKLPLPRFDNLKTAVGPLRVEVLGSLTAGQMKWLQLLGPFLKEMLGGTEPAGRPEVDLGCSSLFEVEVFKAVSLIPWGACRSYGWVAKQIGRPLSARAVGTALGRNPVPVLVPCHRVIRGDGSPGGFHSGIRWKEQLIRLECERTHPIRPENLSWRR